MARLLLVTKLVACILLVVGSRVFAQAPATTCEVLLSCSSCLQQSGCGWAQDDLDCLPGTSTGPSYPFSSTNWIWQSSNCPQTSNNCPSFSSCSSCIANSNCGWDGFSCFTGSNVGSVCTGGAIAAATGLGFGIVIVVIAVPVAVIVTVTSAICFWYRRFYLIRRRAVVVTDIGLTATVNTPYVPVPVVAGPAVNVVY